MAELQRPHQQAGHDLVADAQQQRAVKHVMGQADHRGHGDDVAADQAELHARLALRDAVAHGRHAAGHLGRAARRGHRLLDHGRVVLVGVVGREHVVVGGDDADIGRLAAAQGLAFPALADRQTMGQIAAGQPVPKRPGHPGLLHMAQIAFAMGQTAVDDPVGDFFDDAVHGCSLFMGPRKP